MKSLKELKEADRLFILHAVNAHYRAHQRWTHGDPVEIWRDENKYIRERTRRGLSGLSGRSPDPSESPRTFAASAANW